MLSTHHSGTDGNDALLNTELMRNANISLTGCVGKLLENKGHLITVITWEW